MEKSQESKWAISGDSKRKILTNGWKKIKGKEDKMAEWSNRYSYDDSNVDLYAPKSGGVYRLINKSGEKFYVFYVGQSDDVKRRLSEHLSTSEPDECIRKYLRNYSCYFRFIKIATQSERDRIEGKNIEKYDPKCND